MAEGAVAILLIALILVLAVAYRTFQDEVDPAAESLPVPVVPSAAAEAHPAFLYGRVTTYGGITYEGRLRWGGDEESFWGNYFNGTKDENSWAKLVPVDQLPQERRSTEIFGIEISRSERSIDLERPFMARYGDIARIEAHGEGLQAVLERRLDYDPDVRVTLKSGTSFDLDRLEAGDFDDGVRIWDSRLGVVDLGPRQIRSIEFFSTDQVGDVPDRLHGTVHTRNGAFTGFIQWDREEVIGTDLLVGSTDGGEVRLPFDAIRSIARRSRNSSSITLADGRELVLSGSRKVGSGNRGIYVDDPRYGRVLVSWDAFERLDLSPGGAGPAYEDFPPGRPLTGNVTTTTGRRITGRLVYDLDESETTETLDAPSEGVDYTIPFGMIASIVLSGPHEEGTGQARVILQSGEELHLERTGDLGDQNAGMLIFVDGRERPEYVRWTEIEQVNFRHSATMYPPFGGP